MNFLTPLQITIVCFDYFYFILKSSLNTKLDSIKIITSEKINISSVIFTLNLLLFKNIYFNPLLRRIKFMLFVCQINPNKKWNLLNRVCVETVHGQIVQKDVRPFRHLVWKYVQPFRLFCFYKIKFNFTFHTNDCVYAKIRLWN